jgi:hypothetical protein
VSKYVEWMRMCLGDALLTLLFAGFIGYSLIFQNTLHIVDVVLFFWNGFWLAKNTYKWWRDHHDDDDDDDKGTPLRLWWWEMTPRLG